MSRVVQITTELAPGAARTEAGCGRAEHVLTLVDALEAVADEHARGFTFYDAELNPEWWSHAALRNEAKRRGRYLRSLGLKRGARVALSIEHYADFVLTFFGAISAGIVPVPIAPPLGPRQRGFSETVRGILDASAAELLLASDSLAELLVAELAEAAPGCQVISARAMRDNVDRDFASFADDALCRPEDVCFLQFTSGSTSRPKGVMVSHGNLIANVRGITVEQMQIDPARDLCLAWLPLYHDMGLIGFVCAPLFARMNCVLYPTLAFMWRPSSWLQLIDKHRATISFAPNFAYRLVTQRQKSIESLDLSCLRILGCGAEPISAGVLREFSNTFARAGLSPEAVTPAYGMAEHTLAATFESHQQPLRALLIDRDVYERDSLVRLLPAGSARRALEVVSCGKPFSGHEVAVLKDGRLVGSGVVGEIVLRGPSATAGYYADDAASAELFREGWLRTGDRGFVWERNLYVSGRLKDLIIVNGKNYYPQDIEWELEEIAGLRRGSVVAFSVECDGAERIVIVAEAKSERGAALREAVEARLSASCGLSPEAVLFVAPNTVPKTSSGKVQRRKTRALYLSGAFAASAGVSADSPAGV